MFFSVVFFCCHQDAVALDSQPAAEAEPDGFRVGQAFLLKDPFSQGLRSFSRLDRYCTLDDDGPLVIFIVDEMHRAAGEISSRFNDSLVDFHPIEALSSEVGEE